MITPDEIEKLKEIIDKQFNGFLISHIEKKHFTDNQLNELREAGIDINKINTADRMIYQAYSLGMMSGVIPRGQLDEMSLKDLSNYLKSGQFLALNSYEKSVIQSIELQSLKDVKGIRDRFMRSTEEASYTAQRQYYENTIKKEIQRGIAEKEGLKVISNEISKKLGDFSRDFDRIVQYHSHQAFDEGRAAYFERAGGDDAQVFKDVYPGACKHCVRLYTTAGIGSKPVIFKLSQLRANGTNIGRKTADLKPVIGSTHPYCRCTLNRVPFGHVWDDDLGRFVPDPNFKRKVERKSKVKFEFNGKEYEV